MDIVLVNERTSVAFLLLQASKERSVKMQFDKHLLSVILVSLCCFSVTAVHDMPGSKAGLPVIAHRSDVKSARNPLSYRQMVPARPVNDLKARKSWPTSFLKHDHVLHFVEGTFLPMDLGLCLWCGTDDSSQTQMPPSASQSPFAAHVRLASKLPTLLLEDNDHHLEQISCQGSKIELNFHSDVAISAAWQEIQSHPEMLVITSHIGCNSDQERKPYS